MHHSSSSRALARLNVGPRLFILAAVVALIVLDISGAAARPFVGGPGRPVVPPALTFATESLDGSGNNLFHPTWGEAGTNYLRLAPANYADRHRHDGRRAECALHQQPHLQRPRPEPLLREQHLAVGMGVGTVPRPRHGTARRDARRGRIGRRSTRAIRSSRTPTRPDRSRSTGRPRRPARASRRPASR